MWPDENGNWSIYGADQSAAPSNAPMTETGFGDAFTTAVDFAKNVFGAAASVDQYLFNRQVGQVQLATAKNSLQSSAAVQSIQGQIEVAKAQRALTVAQGGADITAANLQRQLAAFGSSNQLMLWLTVAGVAVAVLQYTKGRK